MGNRLSLPWGNKKGPAAKEKDTEESKTISLFDKFYKKGTVQIFPDCFVPKVTLYKPTGKAKAPPPKDRDHQRQVGKEKKERIKEPPSYLLDENKRKDPNVVVQLNAEKSEFLVLQKIKATLEETINPDDPPIFILHNQDLVVRDKTAKTRGEKDVMVLHPTLGVLILEVKGTERNDVYDRFNTATTQLLHAQEALQQQVGDLLEKDAITLTIALPNLKPEDSVFIRQKAQERKLHKEKLDVTTKTAPIADDAAVTSPSRLAERAVECSSETGDAVGGEAVCSSSAAPPASSPDAHITNAPAKSSRSTENQASPKTSAEESTGDRFKRELLENHPEIHLLCGSTAWVYSEWTRQLQLLRARSGHAFKGSTTQERLENFKRLCVSMCGIPGLRSGQSVKTCADLHSRFLLTAEQLRVRDSEAELLHLSGPPGSGKTLLLAERARRWLREGRSVVLAVGPIGQDVLLHALVRSVLGNTAAEGKVFTHISGFYLPQWLNRFSAEDPVAVILDEIVQPNFVYPELLKHKSAGRVSGLWTAQIQPLQGDLEAEVKKLGGSAVQLRYCLRCPPSIVDWANTVRRDQNQPMLSPQVPVTLELGVEVKIVCHDDHPNFLHSTEEDCPTCNDSVQTFFSGLGVTEDCDSSPLSLRDAVVLTTATCDKDKVVNQLRELGLHAVSEPRAQRDHTSEVPLPGPTSDQNDVEAARSRILRGEDEKGRAALHVMDYENFVGLERKMVVLWHRDWRDNLRGRQKQKHRDNRLRRHSEAWFQVASRCQGRLLVMAVTPSPVLSLLQAPRPSVDLRRLSIHLVSHHRHSQSHLPYWQCRECGQGLVHKLRSLGLPAGRSFKSNFWTNAIVIVTGWSCDGSQVAKWMRSLGVPAAFEEPKAFFTNDYARDEDDMNEEDQMRMKKMEKKKKKPKPKHQQQKPEKQQQNPVQQQQSPEKQQQNPEKQKQNPQAQQQKLKEQQQKLEEQQQTLEEQQQTLEEQQHKRKARQQRLEEQQQTLEEQQHKRKARQQTLEEQQQTLEEQQHKRKARQQNHKQPQKLEEQQQHLEELNHEEGDDGKSKHGEEKRKKKWREQSELAWCLYKYGRDRRGWPALHVVRNFPDCVSKRPVVVLVHHDQEDSNPDHQNQERRDSRRWSHGIYWKQAVSLCQKHLVVMATTPSPLLTPLKSDDAASTVPLAEWLDWQVIYRWCRRQHKVDAAPGGNKGVRKKKRMLVVSLAHPVRRWMRKKEREAKPGRLSSSLWGLRAQWYASTLAYLLHMGSESEAHFVRVAYLCKMLSQHCVSIPRL